MDIGYMTNLLVEMHEETNYHQMAINVEKIQRFLKVITSMDNYFVFLKDGCLMLGKCSNTWFSDDLYANDLILYTQKESRGKGLAEEAISEFIEWASKKDCKMISIGQSSGVNMESFGKLLNKFNTVKVGEVYNVLRK